MLIPNANLAGTKFRCVPPSIDRFLVDRRGVRFLTDFLSVSSVQIRGCFLLFLTR